MLTIRHEIAGDVPAIRSLLIQTFDRPEEANLVEALRDRGAVSLALVALVEGHVVGHILFSPVTIGTGSPDIQAAGSVEYQPEFSEV